MKNQIIEQYIDMYLTHNEAPKNVYVFAKSLNITEQEFYQYYPSIEAIEASIFQEWFKEVKNNVESSELYANYAVREKFLAIYFAWIEALKQHRSFVVARWQTQSKQISLPKTPTFLKPLKEDFIAFSQNILGEGMQSKEITERKFISDKYADAQWLNLLFITNFWVNDHSINFEKSDEAIEKSVNLAFDLMGQTALDSMLNFGKFLFQNR
ncbi:MAG: TetR family transcriptional regulator C-terminal domain-containing protein [Bacteroidota bacterium]|nr:TetR family transcriptional regulator C-terminal domain-containing protein [Bacteroidota bacterium]